MGISVPRMILGGLVAGLVINLGHASFSRIEAEGRFLRCGSGVRLKGLAVAARNG